MPFPQALIFILQGPGRLGSATDCSFIFNTAPEAYPQFCQTYVYRKISTAENGLDFITLIF